MEEIIALLHESSESDGSNGAELVSRFNALISEPETPKILLHFLFENPTEPNNSLIIPCLEKCVDTIRQNFSPEEEIEFMQNLLNLYFSFPSIEVSFLNLYSKLFHDIQTSPEGAIPLLFQSLADENLTEKCAKALPFIAISQDVEFISNLWTAVAPFTESVFENDAAAMLIASFFEIQKRNCTAFIYYLTKSTEIFEFITHFLEAVTGLESAVDNENIIRMSKKILRTLGYTYVKAKNMLPNAEAESLVKEGMIPFFTTIISASENIFEHIPYASVTQHFLYIVQEVMNQIDLSESLEAIVNICILTATIDDDDLELIRTTGNAYYDIAFDKLTYLKTPRIRACDCISLLYEKYGDEIISFFGEVDCECKIRLIAEIAAKKDTSQEFKEYVAEIISDGLGADLDIVEVSSLLYLCSKSIKFLGAEIANSIFEAVITEEMLQNQITFLLICDIISNALSNNILIVSEEKTVEICGALKESEYYTSHNCLSVFSNGFSSFPELFSVFAADFIEANVEIFSEWIGNYQGRSSAGENVYLRSVIQMMKPCIENCHESINFESLFEMIHTFATDIDFIDLFSVFSYFLYFFAYHQNPETELACLSVIEEFISSDPENFSLGCEYIVRFLLIQINKSPEHFMELYSDKSEFIMDILSKSLSFLERGFGNSAELYFLLMFISRLLTIHYPSIDESLAAQIFEFSISKIAKANPHIQTSLGSDLLSISGLWEVVGICLINGLDADISPILGNWSKNARINAFASDYSRSIQVAAMQTYFSNHEATDSIPELIDKLNKNQAVIIDMQEYEDSRINEVLQMQNLVSPLPYIPDGFVNNVIETCSL